MTDEVGRASPRRPSPLEDSPLLSASPAPDDADAAGMVVLSLYEVLVWTALDDISISGFEHDDRRKGLRQSSKNVNTTSAFVRDPTARKAL